MTIDFLDKALLLLQNEIAFGIDNFQRPDFSLIERKLLVRAFFKLEKDNFAYSEQLTDEKNNKTHRFYISFDGLLALETSPFFCKNRPYRWKSWKEKLHFVWNVIKIAAVVINALVILFFTYLTYHKQT